MEYHKIETLFDRDANFGVMVDKLRMPVYGSFKLWHVTEKIDGTNIRVILNLDGTVTLGGKTDNASLPADLVTYLHATFTPEKMKNCFWHYAGPEEAPVKAILYGEGYGAGIQKGGNYRKDKSFRLFDVVVMGLSGDREIPNWLDWENVEDVAQKLGIKTVPFCGFWTLEQIIANVKEGVPSNVAIEDSGNSAYAMAEGIVGRTLQPLFDHRGKRIILKLKTSDFK